MNYHPPPTHTKFSLAPSQEWDYLGVSGKGGAIAGWRPKPFKEETLACTIYSRVPALGSGTSRSCKRKAASEGASLAGS